MKSGAYSRRLDIFVTNRCNLDCAYCSSRGMLQEPRPLALDAGRLKRAVDLFAGWSAPGGEPRTIAFSGGEPLLEYDAVAAAVRHIGGLREKFQVSVTTNGTLLDRRRAEFFLGRGVSLVVSLDGAPAVTDSRRRFRSCRASVAAKVAANLKKLPASLRREIRVAVTVSSSNIASAAEGAAYLESLGLGCVEIGLDVYETWSPRALELLSRTLASFRDYSLCRADLNTLRGGGGAVFKAFFQDYDPEGKVLPVDTLCLSPEGLFFPCDALCAARPRQDAYVLGNLESGVDFGKFKKIYDKAFSFIRRHGSAASVLSPADRYFYALVRGGDPAALLANGLLVDKVFERELGDLRELENALLAAARRGSSRGPAPRAMRAAAGAPPAALVPLASAPGPRQAVLEAGPGPQACRAAALYLLLAARRDHRKTILRLER